VATWESINRYVNQKDAVGSLPILKNNKLEEELPGASSRLDRTLAKTLPTVGPPVQVLTNLFTTRCINYSMQILTFKAKEGSSQLQIQTPQEDLIIITG